jgi:hypothetical protein
MVKLMKPRKTEIKEKEKVEKERNQQEEMVDKQTVNKTNTWRKRKKIPGRKTIEFQS